MKSNQKRASEVCSDVSQQSLPARSVRTSRLLAIAAALAITCLAGYASAKPKQPPAPQPVRVGVLSDIHLYPTSLGTSGSALAAYIAADPKMLIDSEAILNAAIDGLIQEHVKFVIIPGDLTKDGELASHVLMAKHLAKLEQRGIQVYVVPGNHDINNSDAVRYLGDKTLARCGLTPQLFRAIYQRFGYGQAIVLYGIY